MCYIKCYHKTVLQFVYSKLTKINEQTKLNKTDVKIHESL